jgi:hypothetical protein
MLLTPIFLELVMVGESSLATAQSMLEIPSSPEIRMLHHQYIHKLESILAPMFLVHLPTWVTT